MTDWDEIESGTSVRVDLLGAHDTAQGNSFSISADYLRNGQVFHSLRCTLPILPLLSFRREADLLAAIKASRADIVSATRSVWSYSVALEASHPEFTSLCDFQSRRQDGHRHWRRIGPLPPAEGVDGVVANLRRGVSMAWEVEQSNFVRNRDTATKYGVTPRELREVYFNLWRERDAQVLGDLSRARAFLALKAYTNAQKALHEHDVATAADLSRILADIFLATPVISFAVDAPFRLTHSQFMSEFGHLAPRWNGVNAAISQEVVRRGMANNEGVAQWAVLIGLRNRDLGLTRPLTPVAVAQQSGEQEFREELSRLSASNPYRRGLELLEQCELRVGPNLAEVIATMASHPLRTISQVLTLSELSTVSSAPEWAPDARLERLSVVSGPRVTNDARSRIADISGIIDAGMPGIIEQAMKIALTQRR